MGLSSAVATLFPRARCQRNRWRRRRGATVAYFGELALVSGYGDCLCPPAG